MLYVIWGRYGTEEEGRGRGTSVPDGERASSAMTFAFSSGDPNGLRDGRGIKIPDRADLENMLSIVDAVMNEEK